MAQTAKQEAGVQLRANRSIARASREIAGTYLVPVPRRGERELSRPLIEDACIYVYHLFIMSEF